AAAGDTGARIRSDRIAHTPHHVRPLAVGAPLRDVAVHVEKAPGVGPEALHRCREGEAVVELDVLEGIGLRVGPDLLLQGNVSDVREALEARQIISAVKARLCAGTAGELPLRLRRQPVFPLLLLAQPLAKGESVVPGNVDDGIIIRLLPASVPPTV